MKGCYAAFVMLLQFSRSAELTCILLPMHIRSHDRAVFAFGLTWL
jgi:hypothetical protein